MGFTDIYSSTSNYYVGVGYFSLIVQKHDSPLNVTGNYLVPSSEEYTRSYRLATDHVKKYHVYDSIEGNDNNNKLVGAEYFWASWTVNSNIEVDKSTTLDYGDKLYGHGGNDTLFGGRS